MRVTKPGVVLVSVLAGAAVSSGFGASFASASTEPPDSGAITVGGTVPADSATAGTIPDPAECAAGLTLDDGTLTIATGDPAFPPYVLDDDPESGQGFEAAVAYEVADGGLAGAAAAVVAVALVLTVWGLFIAPKARLRLTTVPRSVVSVLLCLGTGWGLIATGHVRWGLVVALAGVLIVAAQVVLPQAEADAS